MCLLSGKAGKSCYISIRLFPSLGSLGSQSFQTAELEMARGPEPGAAAWRRALQDGPQTHADLWHEMSCPCEGHTWLSVS